MFKWSVVVLLVALSLHESLALKHRLRRSHVAAPYLNTNDVHAFDAPEKHESADNNESTTGWDRFLADIENFLVNDSETSDDSSTLTEGEQFALYWENVFNQYYKNKDSASLKI